VFTVTQSAAPALLPPPGAEIDAIDFGFRGASTLHDGELVRFKNDGYLIHMFLFAQAKSAADATKAEALLLAGKGNEAAKKYGTGRLASSSVRCLTPNFSKKSSTSRRRLRDLLRHERRGRTRSLQARDVPHDHDREVAPTDGRAPHTGRPTV
jgi:hypothetical protein